MSGFTFKITKKNGSTRKKILNVLKHDNTFVEVGHFEAQGMHPTINKSFVDIMKLHHNGGSVSGSIPNPPRPVLDILNFRAPNLLRSPKLLEEGKTILKSGDSSDRMLSSIGKSLVISEKSIFGDPTVLHPNAEKTIIQKHGADTPLVETGVLRNKVAYRTSKNKTIKE